MAVRDAKLMTNAKPRFLSVVGKGANRRPFRIFKGEGGDEVEIEGAEDEDAAELRRGVVKSILDRALRIARSLGGIEPSDEVAVQLAEHQRDHEDVFALVFDKEQFGLDDARAWAEEHGFEVAEKSEEDEHGLMLYCAEAGDAECVVMTLGDGVKAVVAREGKGALARGMGGGSGKLKPAHPSVRGKKGALERGQTTGETSRLRTELPEIVRGQMMVAKGFGDGPGNGFVSFDAAVADLEVAPSIMDAFWMAQQVTFNVLNADPADVPDKLARLSAELDAFTTHIVGLVKGLPLAEMKAAGEPTINQATAAALAHIGTATLAAAEAAPEQKHDPAAEAEGEEEVEDMKLSELTAAMKSMIAEGLQPISDRLGALEKKAEGDGKGAEGKDGGGKGAEDDKGAEGDDGKKPEGESAEKSEALTLDQVVAAVKTELAAGLKPLEERVQRMESRVQTRKGQEADGDDKDGKDGEKAKKTGASVFSGALAFGNRRAR